jgi:hypothetical protein
VESVWAECLKEAYDTISQYQVTSKHSHRNCTATLTISESDQPLHRQSRQQLEEYQRIDQNPLVAVEWYLPRN